MVYPAAPMLSVQTSRRALLALALFLTIVPGAHAAALGGWSRTAPIEINRSEAAGAVLDDGSVVLAGGFAGQGGAAASSASRYDPATLTWAPVASMHAGRYAAVGLALADGRALVAGGGDGTTPTATAEIYDRAANSWTLTAPMQAPRRLAAAVRLADGRVLVAGGEGPNGVAEGAEVYDPATDAWTLTGPVDALRESPVLVTLADGRVLMAGGYRLDGYGLPTDYLSSAEIYDPATDAWTPAAAMSEPRLDASAARLADGRVLVAGGHGWPSFPDSSRTAELYDPATDTWSPTGSTAVPRGEGHTMTLLADGRAMVVGGFWWRQIDLGPPASWSGATYEASAEIYDPATGTWASTPALSREHSEHFAALLRDGTVLVAGGFPTENYSERWSVTGPPTPWVPAEGDNSPHTLFPAPGPPAKPTPAPRPAAKAVFGFAKGATRRLVVSKTGAVAVRLTCAKGTGSCRDTLVLKTRGRPARTLGQARVALAAGRSGVVRVRLSRTVRRQLRGRTVKARVTLRTRGRGLDVTVRGPRR